MGLLSDPRWSVEHRLHGGERENFHLDGHCVTKKKFLGGDVKSAQRFLTGGSCKVLRNHGPLVSALCLFLFGAGFI